MSDATPWRAWLSDAVQMGLPPTVFWRLSVLEWRQLSARENAQPLDRAALRTLMTTYPDEDHD
jgi:uncharacterized phage protein (TIGR02216 family)